MPLFYDLYGLVQSENTLKKALQELGKRKLILTRKGQGRYAPDEYQLNLKLLHEEFKRMQQQGKAGHQPLTPSEVAPFMASSGDQVLTPSEGQKLTPCKTVRGSKIDPLRVSTSDPYNRRIIEEKKITEEGLEEEVGERSLFRPVATLKRLSRPSHTHVRQPLSNGLP